MAFDIIYSEEKNLILKATRGIGFEEVLEAIRKKGLLADISHPSRIRPPVSYTHLDVYKRQTVRITDAILCRRAIIISKATGLS